MNEGTTPVERRGTEQGGKNLGKVPREKKTKLKKNARAFHREAGWVKTKGGGGGFFHRTKSNNFSMYKP